MMVAASNAGFALAGMCLGGAGGLGAVWAKAATAAKMKIGSLNPNDGMEHLCSILANIVDDSARIAIQECQRPLVGWAETTYVSEMPAEHSTLREPRVPMRQGPLRKKVN
jgi:hypothetical protein